MYSRLYLTARQHCLMWNCSLFIIWATCRFLSLANTLRHSFCYNPTNEIKTTPLTCQCLLKLCFHLSGINMNFNLKLEVRRVELQLSVLFTCFRCAR